MYLQLHDPAFLAVASGGTPALDLFFSATKALDSRITFTRASTATFINSSGLVEIAASGSARFTHNPSTLASMGLLIEESRTNLLLNSATLSTQNVTVSATAYTLSFTGTGSITRSGTSTGTLTGTGDGEANRVKVTFTPTAGTLTLTVSGTVTNAQLEAGSFATSYIPTTSATVTRAADVATMTGTNFSSWYNQSEWTAVMDYQMNRIVGSAEFPRLFTFQDSAFNSFSRIYLGRVNDATSNAYAQITVSGTNYANLGVAGLGSNTANVRVGASFSSSLLRVAQNNVAADDATVAVPTVDRLYLGSNSTGTNLNGTIARFRFYRRAMPSNIQTLTA